MSAGSQPGLAQTGQAQPGLAQTRLAQPGLEQGRSDLTRAGWDDVEVLGKVVADAFHDLAPARWLVGDPAERRAIFPPYFQIFVELALADGVVFTNADRTAAALWLHAGDGGHGSAAGHAGDGGYERDRREEPPVSYDDRLAAAVGPHIDRFRLFDQLLEERHPAGPAHYHLAMLAVRPGSQRQGIGTAQLSGAHEILDQAKIPAYLEASDEGTRSLYLRHGYADRGPAIQLPEGPCMYPMWRAPVR